MWVSVPTAFVFEVFGWVHVGPIESRGGLRQPRHFAVHRLVRSYGSQTVLRLLFAGAGSKV